MEYDKGKFDREFYTFDAQIQSLCSTINASFDSPVDRRF